MLIRSKLWQCFKNIFFLSECWNNKLTITLSWINILNIKWVLKFNRGEGRAFCLVKHCHRKYAPRMISHNALQHSVIDGSHVTGSVFYHHCNIRDIKSKVRPHYFNFSSWWTLKQKGNNRNTCHMLMFLYALNAM